MSEYWVSHKKYFCKYCNIYIADDVPSRRQHESGLRHKGNVERFVRGLYKEGSKRKQDLEEEKREMARIEQAAQAAHAGDVAAGLVKPGSSSSVPARSASAGPSKPVSKPSNPYANYSTAESLGFTDPDAERRKAEAEYRQTQGVAGEWEFVAIVEPPGPAEDSSPAQPGPAVPAETEESKKRPAEPDTLDDARTFKFRKKTVGVGLGELYDPGIIPVKLKKKEESAEPSLTPQPTVSGSQSASADANNATEKPKWSARGWRKPGETAPATDGQAADETTQEDESSTALHMEDNERQLKLNEPPALPVETPASVEVKQETQDRVKTEDTTVKSESDTPTAPSSGASLFRKRKLPAGAAGSKGRR